MLSWSCGNLPVTVLLSSCGDRICVSVQVELINFLRAVRHTGPQLIGSDRNTVSASRSGLRARRPCGPSPDWKSGASDVLAYRDEGRQPTFVLELVLEGQ